MKSFLLILVLTASALADGNPTRTDKRYNGWFWRILPFSTRVAYVQGHADAIRSLITHHYFDGNGKAQSEVTQLYFADNRTYQDIEKTVSGLYRDPQNRMLPISDMIVFACFQLKGESDREIQAGLSTLRRMYSDQSTQRGRYDSLLPDTDIPTGFQSDHPTLRMPQ